MNSTSNSTDILITAADFACGITVFYDAAKAASCCITRCINPTNNSADAIMCSGNISCGVAIYNANVVVTSNCTGNATDKMTATVNFTCGITVFYAAAEAATLGMNLSSYSTD